MRQSRTLVVVDRIGKERTFYDASIKMVNGCLEVHASGRLYIFVISNLICYYFIDDAPVAVEEEKK